MSGSMLVTITGTGCSHAREQMSTNMVVEYEGYRLGVECPHPIMYQAHKYGVAAEGVNAWYVTHIHADHVSGLESLAFYRWYSMGKQTVLCAAREVLDPLSRIHRLSGLGRQTTLDGEPAGLNVGDVCKGVPTPPGQVVNVGPFTVETLRVRHVVPTYAVKITSPDGSSFGYSGDTTADGATLQWLAKCDMFAHDSCGGAIHAGPTELADILSRDERRRCMLLHRSDESYEEAESQGFLVPKDGDVFRI